MFSYGFYKITGKVYLSSLHQVLLNFELLEFVLFLVVRDD